MKRAGTALILLMGLFVAGCGPKPPSKAEEIFKGEHQLRRMVERSETTSSISGGFLLFVGGIDGSTTTRVLVKFAWQMNDGTCAISSLPLEKIRVKLDEETITPTIKFRWRAWYFESTPQVQELMDRYVVYALITAKKSDWPIQVNLPLNSR